MTTPRTLCRKLPHSAFLYRLKVIDSPVCRVCRESYDDELHFLVRCPKKQEVWRTVMNYRFPTYNITDNMVFEALTKWTISNDIHYLPKTAFRTILLVTHYNIWSSYWQYIIKQVPYNTK
ncbi:hypothetical protein BY458DRAFT_505456, partial [Sporodiniella umbellata]